MSLTGNAGDTQKFLPWEKIAPVFYPWRALD